jgi:hypothetical protein
VRERWPCASRCPAHLYHPRRRLHPPPVHTRVPQEEWTYASDDDAGLTPEARAAAERALAEARVQGGLVLPEVGAHCSL